MEQRKRRFVTRLFVALDLPANIIAEAKNIQFDIQANDLILGNFTKPENIHLTLKFLGEVPEREIDAVKDALRPVQHKQFSADIDELGVFSAEFVRILWLHLAGQDILDLQAKVDEVLQTISPKENKFQSHITIARVHNVKSKQNLLDYVKEFKVKKTTGLITSFSLMKSTLTDKGSIFEVLERYELQ